MFQSYYYFSSGVSFFKIPDGLGNLAQRERPVDHRRELAGLDELLEDDHVLVVLRGHERAQLLAHERGHHERPEQTSDDSEPPSSLFASDEDEGPLGGEGASEARQRRVPADVEDHVVATPPFGEVLACVVYDVVRADGPYHLRLRGAAHAGGFRSEIRPWVDEDGIVVGYRFVDPPVARYTPSLTVTFQEGADGRPQLALTTPGDFEEGDLVYPFTPVGAVATPGP